MRIGASFRRFGPVKDALSDLLGGVGNLLVLLVGHRPGTLLQPVACFSKHPIFGFGWVEYPAQRRSNRETDRSKEQRVSPAQFVKLVLNLPT